MYAIVRHQKKECWKKSVQMVVYEMATVSRVKNTTHTSD